MDSEAGSQAGDGPRRAAARSGRGRLAQSAGLALILAITTALVGITLGIANPAVAAAGPPFNATTPVVYVSTGPVTSTQLAQLTTDASGTSTLTNIGPAANFGYNALSYNPVDNYLYAISSSAGTASNGAAVPTNALIRIGQNGYTTRIGAGTYGVGLFLNTGGIGADGLMYVSSGTTLLVINPTTGALVKTVTLSSAFAPDITYASGYFWSIKGGAVTRYDPTTGAFDSFSVPSVVSAGGAWTYGNGNLGGITGTGVIEQVSITNPASASPTFTLVSMTSGGPSSSNTDAASSSGLPTDVSLVKTGPSSFVAGQPVTYTLKVTNHGPSISSGFVVTDTVPTPLTSPTSSNPGCTVSGATVTCVSGTLAVGASQTFTITAQSPASMSACVTNAASVLGNESDPVTLNNTSSVNGCPAAVSLVKTASIPSYGAAGQSVTYTFTGKNTGAVTLHNVQIAEGTFTGTGSMSALTCNPALGSTLAAGATMVCTALYTTTQPDVNTGSLANTATITGLDPLNETVTATSSVTVPATQSVQVNKAWIIQNSSGVLVGTYHVPAQVSDTAPTVPAGFSATPTLSNQTSPLFGTAYPGYIVGQNVTVGEGPVTVPSGCTVTSQKVTAVNGTPLAAAAAVPFTVAVTGAPAPNNMTITNTITCDQTLTLVKKVAFGSLSPTAWNLTGIGPSGSLTGPSGATGSAGVTGVSVTPQVAYTLAESSTVAGSQNYVPAGTGWVCAAGATPVSVSNAQVTIGYGQNVTCTITNTTAKVSVLKHIQDPADGLTAGLFTVTLTPPSGLGAASTVTGAENPTATNTFEVRPGSSYTLTEQAASPSTAYLALGLQQSTDGGATWTTVAGNQATAAAGTQVLYRFVNESAPAITLPLTGGVGTDVLTYSALALFGATTAGAIWQLLRRRQAARR